MRETVLIIDSSLKGKTKDHPLHSMTQYHTVHTYSLEEALNWMHIGRKPIPDIIIMDIPIGRENDIAQDIMELKRLNVDVPILVMLQYGYEALGAKMVEAGCLDFLCKPVSVERLRLTLQNTLKMQRMSNYITWLEKKIAGHVDIEDMIGENPEFRDAINLARQAVSSRLPVWLEGEPGTGKTILGRAIHGSGDRVGKPFVAVNCELLPEDLAPGMLFGQEHTAPANKVHFILGKIREADQGTLLLQEVAALQPELRWQIIDMLQSGQITPVGSTTPLPINVRVIFANSNNEKYFGEREIFRQQLAQRYQLHSISMPPLSRRRDDIALLAKYFLLVHATSENKYISSITDRALEWLEQCQWPGNVGELANIIWRAVLLCEGDMIDINEIQMVHKHRSVYLYTKNSSAVFTDGKGQAKTLKSVQEEVIRFALQQTGGCMTRAARSLGIGRSTLYRKVSEYGLDSYISRANQTTRPIMNVSSIDRS